MSFNASVDANSSRRLVPNSNRQGGFAILEAMVAIVIFALGILGLIGIQGAMTKEQTGSKVRTDASYLASEIIGLMWTDIPNLGQYKTGNCSGYARCSGWTDKAAKILPSGLANIAVNEATGVVTVSLFWTMPGGDSHQFITETTIVKSDAS